MPKTIKLQFRKKYLFREKKIIKKSKKNKRKKHKKKRFVFTTLVTLIV